MGERETREITEEGFRTFVRALLDDLTALESMIERGMIESGVSRIGAEQEMFLIDAGSEPAPVAMEVLRELDDPRFTTELARFNLEANLPPAAFGGDCLRRLESNLEEAIAAARKGAAACDAEVVLTGILPTVTPSDLTLDNLTPAPRYLALNEALVRMRGGEFQIRIKGIDELFTSHDNVMCESCNTSFQIHFQVDPPKFARLYNVAQAITAPVLAAAVNSPVFLGHRLWHETRVALFQHSIDVRRNAHAARGQAPRVHFGDGWVRESILEIFREDVARYRAVVGAEIEESSLDVLDAGGIPDLRALCLHNGTVYRWNRPCYGVTAGVPHLRIENRALPAGPSVVDEVANAAFLFGLLAAYSEEGVDVTRVMSFQDAKANFLSAARLGLHAQMTWFEGKTSTASELILERLLPDARKGLEAYDIDAGDIERYLGVIGKRVESGTTGSQWILRSLEAMEESDASRHERYRALTSAMLARQKTGDPVHAWAPARVEEAADWRHSYRTVGQFMTRDLFTVRPDDLVDLAANLMDWEHIRHVPVEDNEGRLVGLVSHRTLLRLLARGKHGKGEPVPIRDIMKPDPITVTPETSSMDAIEMMRKNRVACLPVVSGDRLVGILTERDLINVAAKLLTQQLREFSEE